MLTLCSNSKCNKVNINGVIVGKKMLQVIRRYQTIEISPASLYNVASPKYHYLNAAFSRIMSETTCNKEV